MDLLVDRYEQSANGLATIGHLSIDGESECFTLEDKVRELPGIPVERWKIKGQSAIPVGRYKVTLVWSPKHQCMVPLVNDVPGFTAIEIHWGNTDADTEGCLLVGNGHVAGQNNITGSVLAWNDLMPKLESAMALQRAAVDGNGRPLHYNQIGEPEDVWITYRNSFPVMVVSDPDLAT